MNLPEPIPFEICYGGEWVIAGFVHPGVKHSDCSLRDGPEVTWGMVTSEETGTIENFQDWLAAREPAQGWERQGLEDWLESEAIESVRDKLPRDLPFEPEWDDNERIR